MTRYCAHRLKRIACEVILATGLLCSGISCDAQAFSEVALEKGVNISNVSPFFGGGLSFYDFNKDGWDDLTFCTKGDSIAFFVNLDGYFSRVEIIPNAVDAKQPTWVDYDNDGDADIFITRKGGKCLLYRNDGWPNFTNVSGNLNLPDTQFSASYGCSWGDYDRDGWLDVYIANYNNFEPGNTTVNWLLHNNQDGTFTEVGQSLGVDNGYLPSFQAIWFDYDLDGWPDLYSINDKNFGNALFHNLGGTFEDVSLQTGAGVQMDAMCSSISDVDNDGDFDIYITDDFGNQLLRCNEGNYVNTAPGDGLAIYAFSWAGLFIDYNLDGWDDLYVKTVSSGEEPEHFFINNQDGTFTPATVAAGFYADETTGNAAAKGDFNNDGYWDFAVNNQSPSMSALWMSSGGNSNWFKFSLEGTLSNRDGVGTLIEYWLGDQRFIKQSYSGENYLSQDSQYEILGLSSNAVIDSLYLHWTSGWVDRFYDLAAQSTRLFVEGETFDVSIESSSQVLCGGDSISLTAVTSFPVEQFEWTDGSLTDEVIIYEPGIYTLVTTVMSGWQDTLSIEINEVIPQWAINSVSPTCAGFSDGALEVELFNSLLQNVVWNDSIVQNPLMDIASGIYHYTLTSEWGCITGDSVFLSEPGPIEAFVISDIPCFGESQPVMLEITGGMGQYSVDWNGLDPENMFAGQYSIHLSDQNNCEMELTFDIFENPEMLVNVIVTDANGAEGGSLSVDVEGGSPPYSFLWNTGSVLSELVDLPQGSYQCTVTDAMGCTVEVDAVILNLGLEDLQGHVISVFPNPVSDYLTVECLVSVGATEMIIEDVRGRIVLRERLVNGRQTISLTDLVQGIYVLKCGEFSTKVVKL